METLLADYLAAFSFRQCRIDHLEVDPASYARIDLTAVRGGDAGGEIMFRLALQVEQGRWVAREIRESTR